MRKTGLFLVALLAVVILLPALAQGEFYVGAYLGPSFASSIDPDFQFHANPGSNRLVFANRTAFGVSVDPSLLVGGKIGYWFARESVFGYKMPSWLKYLGFELDFSYQNLHWPRQEVNIEPINLKQVFEMNGSAVTVSFLFLARYGFYRSAEYPQGRLQPYIGAGPVLFITNTHLNIGGDFRSTEADLGFAVETGLRYMIRPKISLYTAFRYRYLPNHVDVDDKIFDFSNDFKYVVMRSTYNMFDLVFGAAYHF